MSAIKNNTVEVRFRTTQELRSRLAHHAKRLGLDMNDIVRDGMIARLEFLDEREMLADEAKRARERRGAFVPTVVEHKWGTPKGLGTKKPLFPSATLTPLPPEKIERSFRRYAEYLETATDKIDRELRTQTVLDDIKERTSSEEEYNASYDALLAFLKAREEARHKPVDVISVNDAITVSGDVE